MAERYEEILALEKNQWTYGSPILIKEGRLEHDSVGKKNFLTVNFINICDTTLKEVYLTVYATDEEGEVSEIKHEYRELHLAPMEEFGSNVKLQIEDENARDFKLKITKIVCEMGTVWEKDEIFEPNKDIKDIEAFGKAMDEEYETNYQKCRELIKNDDSEKLDTALKLLKSLEWYKNCDELLEYATRKHSITLRTEKRKKKESERKQVRKKKIMKIACGMAIVAAVALIIAGIAFATIVVPNHKIQQAENYNKNGQYEKAMNICKELNGYGKSKEILKESYYQIGFKAYDQQDFEKCVEYLNKCKGYKAADKLLAQSNYNLGNNAIDAKKYDDAINYFNKSMELTQDKTIINHDKSGIAKAYYSKGDTASAWKTIQEVYKADNSEEEAYNSYGYAYAVALQKAGKLDEAVGVYKMVLKYKDSKTQYGTIIYNKAVKTAEAGDLKKASEQLKEVKDYYDKAGKLYNDMTYFINITSSWVGTWKIKGSDTSGEKLKISTLMYKGELCLKITDEYLKYDTIISSKKRVTQISVGSERIFYKLKKFHNYKITLQRNGNKMSRYLKYQGVTYKRKYKKNK